jgi:hypothetical protein
MSIITSKKTRNERRRELGRAGDVNPLIWGAISRSLGESRLLWEVCLELLLNFGKRGTTFQNTSITLFD